MPPKAKEYDWVLMQELHDKGFNNKQIASKMNVHYNVVRRAFAVGLVEKRVEYKPKHTDETKKLISQKRKRYLRENKDSHPWKKDTKFKSVPCQLLKKELTKHGIVYVEEYEPLEDRYYSIDIAFPHIKLGIEINGNQHYKKDGSLKQYYQERHNNIEDSGWELKEYHYTSVYNSVWMDSLINSLKRNKPLAESDKVHFEKKEKKRYFCKCGNETKTNSDQCVRCSHIKNRKVERPSYDQLKKEIEETSYVAVGKKYGVSDNAVRKWVKNYEKALEL